MLFFLIWIRQPAHKSNHRKHFSWAYCMAWRIEDQVHPELQCIALLYRYILLHKPLFSLGRQEGGTEAKILSESRTQGIISASSISYMSRIMRHEDNWYWMIKLYACNLKISYILTKIIWFIAGKISFHHKIDFAYLAQFQRKAFPIFLVVMCLPSSYFLEEENIFYVA